MKKRIINALIKCFKRGNKVLICGNGGSASMSQHMAAELMGKFEQDRNPLPAIALTTDTSFLTSCSNDYSFQEVFERQVRGLGKLGDVVIGISTSGNSENVNRALFIAQKTGMVSIDFPRKGKTTAEIQEFQLKLMHSIVREVEKAFI
jgi:D-sedoheptulose 7-phosphate isomerase